MRRDVPHVLVLLLVLGVLVALVTGCNSKEAPPESDTDTSKSDEATRATLRSGCSGT